MIYKRSRYCSFFPLLLLMLSSAASASEQEDSAHHSRQKRRSVPPVIVTAITGAEPLKRIKSPRSSPRAHEGGAPEDNAVKRIGPIVPARVGKVTVACGEESSYEPIDVPKRYSFVPDTQCRGSKDASKKDLQSSDSDSIERKESFSNVDFEILSTALSVLKNSEQENEESDKQAPSRVMSIKKKGDAGPEDRCQYPQARGHRNAQKIEKNLQGRDITPLSLSGVEPYRFPGEPVLLLGQRVRMVPSAREEEAMESGGQSPKDKEKFSRDPYLPVGQGMGSYGSGGGCLAGSGHSSPVSVKQNYSPEQISILASLDAFDKKRTTFFWDLEQQKEQDIILKVRPDRSTDEVYKQFKGLNFKEYYEEGLRGKYNAIKRDASTILCALVYIADDLEEALSHYRALDKGVFIESTLKSTYKTLDHLYKFFEGYGMSLVHLHTCIWSIASQNVLSCKGLSSERLAGAQLSYMIGMQSLATLRHDFLTCVEARRLQQLEEDARLTQRKDEEEGQCQEIKKNKEFISSPSSVQTRRKKSSPADARTELTEVEVAKKQRSKMLPYYSSSGEGSPSSTGTERESDEGGQKKQGLGSKFRNALFQ